MPETKRSPLDSRKFIAYLLAEGSWKAALLIVLVMGMKNGAIDIIVGGLALAIILVAGFVEAGFILGLASLDKYTRIAEIASQNGKSFSMGGLQIGHAPAPETVTKPAEKGAKKG